ncbi:transcription elongation factor GreB [endosymbiont of unidentified scaly snail isolate Monju]|uniref:transcription elongation factor GreB n=1 Tax=endosymbiont of unidentified scaly snail isolate Monju TaxID=1248727 RepID=UPI000389254F|nr:transcription elongation factor GreB [endosymbiont of unidentified scaly snail isolate Monju]BAN69775.1 transcription elongation factor GreB [endosymbiont of unidentified scaly snail isolate Monju]
MARSPHITREGFEALKAEQRALWDKRRKVVKHLAAAAAEGDRSENAEYIYRKKQLRDLDRRIRYLQKRIPELKVVERAPDDPERVYFGAWVELADRQGETHAYRIVGADEFDPKRRWISIDSPMARALLGRALDEPVRVRLPDGEAEFEIIDIRYDNPA